VTRLVPSLVLVAYLTSCDGKAPIAEDELSIRVVATGEDLQLGKAFPVQVARIWSQELEPEAWEDGALAPLVVRLERTRRRDDGIRVEEVRDYRGYAFDRESIVIPPVTVRAFPKAGGSPRVTMTDPIKLSLKPALDRTAPGAPELPSHLARPVRWLPWSLLAAALLAAFGVIVRVTRRRQEATPEPAPTVVTSAQDRALERLRRLRASHPRDSGEADAFSVEATTIVRDYLVEQFGIRAREMTTEEILAPSHDRWAPTSDERASLSAVLDPCDLVKFAKGELPEDAREAVLNSAESFVRHTPSARRTSSP
jgi:hypothetical protein